MKHIFIVNPKAGSGRYAKVLPIIQNYFSDKEDFFEIRFTDAVGHASEIASEYRDNDTVLYCVGGDGTSHEVLNGLNDGVSMAIIPVGSGNDFWRMIDYDEPLEKIVVDTIEGKNVMIDVGQANNHRFLNCANIGFDAEVNLGVNSFRFKWFPRTFIYAIFAIKGLIAKKNVRFRFEYDGKVEEHHSLLTSFMNGRWYGGGFESAPRAELLDGLLDVCIVKDVSRRKILRLIPVYYKGNHLDLDVVSFHKLSSFTIKGDEEIVYGLDGETFSSKDIKISVLAHSVSLRVPNKVVLK